MKTITPRNTHTLMLAAGLIAATVWSVEFPAVHGGESSLSFRAPEFTGTSQDDWINSAPLSIKDISGHVVLIDFWTFDCWNCYRSFPWLLDLEKRHGPAGLQVIGVHTPEFDHERVRANVEAKIKEFQLQHPVMMDNDFHYWRAMNNRYWPAFYILDKHGRVRGSFFGETHIGDRRAQAIEALIQDLLAEA